VNFSSQRRVFRAPRRVSDALGLLLFFPPTSSSGSFFFEPSPAGWRLASSFVFLNSVAPRGGDPPPAKSERPTFRQLLLPHFPPPFIVVAPTSLSPQNKRRMGPGGFRLPPPFLFWTVSFFRAFFKEGKKGLPHIDILQFFFFFPFAGERERRDFLPLRRSAPFLEKRRLPRRLIFPVRFLPSFCFRGIPSPSLSRKASPLEQGVSGRNLVKRSYRRGSGFFFFR